MNKLKLIIPVIAILLNTGCASFGPTVLIETPEPAEDFVVLCEWYKSSMINLHGSGRSLSYSKVFITESGKEVDCGMSIFGGVAGASILHPLYTNMQGEDVDGVSVIRPKSKLEIIDEQKAKFEAGFWDKYKNPGFEYANNLVSCGFGHKYLDYYSEAKEVNIGHFKQLYHVPMLKCLSRTFDITKKYRPAASSRLPSAEVWMNKMWESDSWKKYK